MKTIRTIIKYKFLLGFLLSFLLAWVFEQNIRFQPSENIELSNVQEVVKQKTNKVDAILGKIEARLDSVTLKELMHSQDFVSNEMYEKEGIVFLGYSADSLVFWTDNLVPVEHNLLYKRLFNDVAKLKNGWFIIRHNYIDDYELFGLILIKNEYSYQNEFIKSNFLTEYNIEIPVSVGIDAEKGYPIKDHNQNYLFSLKIKSSLIYNKTNVYISSAFYFLSLVFLFLLIRLFIHKIRKSRFKNIAIVGLAFALFILRYLMLEYHFPLVFKQLELFQPHHFAISMMIPSLGDLLLHAAFVLFFFMIFYLESVLALPSKKVFRYLLLISFLAISVLLFWFVHYYFESLILHSSINFDVYQFFDLSIYTLFGFLIIVLFLGSIFLFAIGFSKY